MAASEGNQYAIGNEGGRPSKYKEEFAQQAYKLCLLGATDEVMADFFGVHVDTINEWKHSHQEFSVSVRRGKLIADMEVGNKLYDKAIGPQWVEEQAIKIKVGQYEERVEIVEIHKAAPPDFQALAFWLKNRQPKQWRDKIDHEHAGVNGGAIGIQHLLTPEDVAAFNSKFDKEY